VEKYRVKQIGNMFHPQKKILFFWIIMTAYTPIRKAPFDAVFCSNEQAQSFIRKVANSIKIKREVIIHPYKPVLKKVKL
jgi:hypothetical protein